MFDTKTFSSASMLKDWAIMTIHFKNTLMSECGFFQVPQPKEYSRILESDSTKTLLCLFSLFTF